jgi:hypothetical protein
LHAKSFRNHQENGFGGLDGVMGSGIAEIIGGWVGWFCSFINASWNSSDQFSTGNSLFAYRGPTPSDDRLRGNLRISAAKYFFCAWISRKRRDFHADPPLILTFTRSFFSLPA